MGHRGLVSGSVLPLTWPTGELLNRFSLDEIPSRQMIALAVWVPATFTRGGFIAGVPALQSNGEVSSSNALTGC